MRNTDTIVIIVAVWLVGGAIGLAILYAVIKAAVLAALRQHTLSSVTAVSVMSTGPGAEFRVAPPRSTE